MNGMATLMHHRLKIPEITRGIHKYKRDIAFI